MVMFVNPDDETTESMRPPHIVFDHPTKMFMCPPGARKKIPVRGTHLAVGFGLVTVTLNGVSIWSGDDERVSLYKFERLARKYPGKWEVYFHGPLQGKRYLRTALNTWELTDTDEGFA